MSKSCSNQTGFAEPLHDPKDALLDIVFVHGLRGDREGTWTKGDTIWPKDLLPKRIPQARILTFGYDADVWHFWSQPASDNTIKDHADTLTVDLSSLRYENNHKSARPIIFVAHSLGGLVCAKALSDAEDSLQPNIKSISDCTRRIAFLGTPHQGSDKAHWVELGKKFLSFFSQKSTGELLQELERGSSTLLQLEVSFLKYLSHRAEKPETKVEVMCFFEELGSKVSGSWIGKIVTEELASLPGHPKVSIRADHCGMCKFSDDKDGNYQRVAGVLERWARELKEESKAEDDRASPPYFMNNATFGDNNQGQQFGILKSSGPINFGSGGTWNMRPS